MQVSVLKGREAVCHCRFASPHYVIISPLVGQLGLGSPQVWWLGGHLHHLLAVGGGCQDRARA
jgi:hypothetical protein